MNILQVVSSFPPAYSYGGVPKVTYEISKELVKRGHDVSVYTTDVYDSKTRFKGENFSLVDGIEVKRFRNISNRLAYSNFSLAPKMAAELNRSIKNFDIVHLREYRSFQAIFLNYYAKKYSIPYIFQAHGSLLPFFEKISLKKFYDLVIGRKILHDAEKIIALTNTEREQYNEMGLENKGIEVIPNGIDLSLYNNTPFYGKIREKYDISDDENVILYLGRIHKIKGINLLLKSFKLLFNDITNVKLVIVGPGDTSKLKKMIKGSIIENNVIFTGPLYGEDKYDVFVDSDLYILPSIYDTFPNTVLEAFSFGKPVIVTEGCGIKDIIDGTAGYVVKYDKNSLKDAMHSIITNETLKHSFGENGKQLINDELNWKSIVDRIEILYENTSKRGF